MGRRKEVEDFAYDEKARHKLEGSRMELVQGDPIEGGDVGHEGRDGKRQTPFELVKIPSDVPGGRIGCRLTLRRDDEFEVLADAPPKKHGA